MHGTYLVNLRQPNLSWPEGKAGTTRPWVLSHRYWTWHCKAAQPMPVPTSLQPSITLRASLTMWILPPQTAGLALGLLGSKHEDTTREMTWHHSATNMLVRTYSWYYSSTISPQVPSIPITNNTQTRLSHRTHARAQKKRFRSPLRRKASTPNPLMPSSGLAPENLPTSIAF